MSVELREVRKSFGSVTVLQPFSLRIETGELMALLGPSGCGKTTTLRIIAGLEEPDTGQVLIEGADVTALPPERRQLGMVFQHYAIWPHRSIGENVAYPLERQRVSKAERRERVREALAQVHLEALVDRRPHQLSGGQLQRIALARALVARPRVLLLDEPLSNLDAALREELRAEIRQLQRRLRITTVLVTHDQEEALSIADRVAVLNAGRIEQLGTPEEIYRRPASEFVARFVGGGNVLSGQCLSGRIQLGQLFVAAPAGTPDGPVLLVARPEEVRLHPAGAEALLRERLYYGDRVELRLELHGQPLRALLPVADADGAQPGSTVRVMLTRFQLLPPCPAGSAIRSESEASDRVPPSGK